MKPRKFLHTVAGILILFLGVGAFSLTLRHPAPIRVTAPAQAPAPAGNNSTKPVDPRDVNPDDVPNKVANFLGNLTPGATPEAAGRERNYVVSYQVDFLRKQPGQKTTEEGMTYEQLQAGEVAAPYVFYGETVSGKYDPAQPGVIAIRATIDGKDVSGYVDAAKLWLEPPLDAPRGERYMAVGEVVAVHVLPSLTSPPALTLLQGEVVDAVGVINSQGQDWVKARFNIPDRTRYGFLAASEVQPLSLASVNQSKVTLKEVPGRIRSTQLKFSAGDQKQLSQAGFYIEPVPPLKEISVDDMADAYQNGSPDEQKIGEQYFITTDLFLHAYHLIFDRMLQDMEEKRLLPAATHLSLELARTAEAELKAAPTTATAYHDALTRDLLYFSVPAKVLDPTFTLPAEVRPQAETLVARINAGTGELPSTQNFLGLEKEDFTQYKVRGHYAKNAAMQRYFRGMMWYGRRSFLLSDKTQTLAAILLPHLVEAARARDQFVSIDYQVTNLIGRQDRYSLEEYREVNRKVFGTETPGLKELGADLDAKLAAYQATAWKDLPPPRIVTGQTGLGLTQDQRLRSSAGMQFLGQRFVLDAFFLNQLTSPSVGTDQNPRNLPSALDVMTVLGSSAAADLQQAAQKEHQWANYDAQMAKLKQQAETPYVLDESLARLRTLFLSTGSKQMFMLGAPWQYKSLNTAGASWTELKHDTLLYAEQSAAEMGGGDEFRIPPYVPPPPKGYVEPNPEFFHRLTDSIDEMLLSMRGSDGLTDEYADKFTLFRNLSHRAAEIAQEEVFDQPISSGDYDWIKTLRWSFNESLLLPRGSDEIKDPSQLQMALVADVATDAVDGQVLEEGVGTPQRIVVLVKDAFGGTRLTVGYVYSWFEFPSNKRWSDAEWKKLVYSGDAATRKQQGIPPPAWYSQFLRNADGAP